MDSIVIVSPKRTPLGAFNGQFKDVTAVELGSSVVKGVTKNMSEKVDTLYMGNVLSAGLGQSAARQVSIGANLLNASNCVNINKVCGSGMAAIMMASNAILAGEAEICVAGGMESMTNAPYMLCKARNGYRFGDGKIIDHMIYDGLLDAYEKCVMGEYAEDVAEKYGFTREDQDRYAIKSFNKARLSIKSNIFTEEISPVTISNKKGEIVIDTDEVPFSVDLDKIPNLRAAFKKDGTITAASASSISDGAAAMLLMKESKANELCIEPIARIASHCSFAQDPKLFALAPIGAIENVLKKSKWNVSDVDLWEINEAFAVVAMAASCAHNIDIEKINVHGGSCALGHPLGTSGARIVVTLLNALKTRGLKKGLATLCVGGGEGVAMTLEMY